jgi:hypothetical protein
MSNQAQDTCDKANVRVGDANVRTDVVLLNELKDGLGELKHACEQVITDDDVHIILGVARYLHDDPEKVQNFLDTIAKISGILHDFDAASVIKA